MATYVLTIAGATKTLRAGTLRISETINGRNTLECEVVSTNGSYRPAIGAEVILTENGTRIFGGNIDQPVEEGLKPQGGVGITTRIRAVDFNAIANRRTITATISTGTTKAALQYLITNGYLDGVTLSGSQADGPTLPELTFDGVWVADALGQIATLSGDYIWEINYSKVLRAFASSALAAPFNIVPASDSNAIGDITAEPTEVEYANRITVKAGQGAREVTETFTGNGSTTVFSLGYTLIGSRGYVTHAGANETLGTSAATWIVDTSVTPHTITRSSAPANLAAISITYTAQFPYLAQANDTGEQGSRGIWERTIPEPDVFDKAVADALATQYLAQAKTTFKFANYETLGLGLFVGRTQTITVPDRNLSGTFLITDIDTRDLGDQSTQVIRTVRAVSGTKVPRSWRDTYKEWSGGSSGTTTSAFQFDSAIIPILSGEFPGDVVAHTDTVANIADGGVSAREMGLRGVRGNATVTGPAVVLGKDTDSLGWMVLADFSRPSPASRGVFLIPLSESSTNRYAVGIRQDASGVTGEYYLVPNAVTSLFLGAPSSWGFGSGFRITKGWFTDFDVSNGYTAYGRSVKEGEWNAIAHNDANFLGDGVAADWTVASGDQIHYKSCAVGKKMTVSFAIEATSVSNTPTALQIVVPATIVGPHYALGLGVNNGAANSEPVLIAANHGASFIAITRIAGAGDWSNATDATYVYGQITFEIS